MKVFSGTANPGLAEKIAKKLHVDLSPLEIHIFPDGEKRIRVEEAVVEVDCVVVEPTAPPVDQNFMELFFIIDALKRSGARSVTAVVPYLGYQRQDHVFRDGEAVSLDVVIETMERVGTDRFLVCDLHSIKIPELFHKPVVHVSALPLFTEKIKWLIANSKWPIANCILVSPDMGGIRRIKMLSELLEGMPYATIVKNRDLATGAVSSNEIEGDVSGKTAFVVDDMISSGGTIQAACELLEKKGAKAIYVFATHPVFSEDAPKILESSKTKKIFVTNTIHVPRRKMFSKLEVLSIASSLAEKVKEG